MKILKREALNDCLYKYYQEHYGERDTDVWYDQPAVNVWVFRRDGKFIILKSHMLTGEVTEQIEQNFFN